MARAVAVLVLACLLLGSGACGDRAAHESLERSAPPTSETPTASSLPSRRTEPETSSDPPAPRRADLKLAHRFEAFAIEPTRRAATTVPFAPNIALGLGPDVLRTLNRSELGQRSRWRLNPKSGYFRAVAGPFSAIDLIERHVLEAGAPPRPGGLADLFDISIGPHPHCASPPMPAPTGLRRLRRVSLQPNVGTFDGCLSWFTVDLFVDTTGHVNAVTVDVWEP